MHQDVEREMHIPFPHQDSRDPGSVVSFWVSTSSHRACTIGTQKYLLGVEGIRPNHFG